MPSPFLVTTQDQSPINDIKTVTPSDSVDLPNGVCRALIITGTGNLKFDTANGTTVTLPIGAAWFGVQYIRAKRIYATGTTVSSANIFACY